MDHGKDDVAGVPSRPPVNLTRILSFTYFERSRMASRLLLLESYQHAWRVVGGALTLPRR